MSLFEELIEDKEKSKKIVKSFKSKDTLTPQIFDEVDGEFHLKSEIRKRLLEIGDNFIESFGVDFFIHDIILTGSLANYNWSQYSDVDLHIVIDMEEIVKDKDKDYVQNIFKEFFDAKKNIWNEKHDIKIKGYDVEVYVQDLNEPHVSSGVYSILHDKWLVEPDKVKPNIDDKKIVEKGEEYVNLIDNLIKSPNQDNILDKIDNLRQKIKTFRQSGLESGGEYSYENLTFKLLRRNGYIEKLLNFKNDVINKKLSLTQ